MDIHTIKKVLNKEEVDYQSLLTCLRGYTSPRDKIGRWLKEGSLIRVKKGLYVFGPELASREYSIALLANLIYGPSAISLHYALSYYGLIPERVSVVTSITPKRNKYFKTPMGAFSYRYLHPKKYGCGIQLVQVQENIHCLMASPEKALCDLIYFNNFEHTFNSVVAVQAWLLEDLRLDVDGLKKIDYAKLKKIAAIYGNTALNDFVTYFKVSA
jgi:predicted transcriptional regulator of viral defense system